LKIQFDFSAKNINLAHVMTLAQFRKAFAIADDKSIDLSNVDDNTLFGFGLASFKPVPTTLSAVAKVIRHQALQFNGQWDAEALVELTPLARRKFIILD
jgi:hypothetical protein